MADDKLKPAEVQAVAAWAGLPCDAARAERLSPHLAGLRARMRRMYAEDVEAFEFDFLSPRS